MLAQPLDPSKEEIEKIDAELGDSTYSLVSCIATIWGILYIINCIIIAIAAILVIALMGAVNDASN